MTTLVCPASAAELRAAPAETRVWCPRCATRHDRDRLAVRDDTTCACGHRLAAHGRHHGYRYACPLSTCTCNTKEKPMAKPPTTKVNHRAEAERYLAAAEAWMHPSPYHVGAEMDIPDRIAGRTADLLAANAHALLAEPPVSTVRIDAP